MTKYSSLHLFLSLYGLGFNYINISFKKLLMSGVIFLNKYRTFKWVLKRKSTAVRHHI